MWLLLTAGVLLMAGVFFFGYYNIPFAFDKWSGLQQKEAKKATSKLEDAFIFITTKKLYFIYLVSPLALSVLGFIFIQIPGLVIGAIAGVVLPFVIIKSIIAKRMKTFTSQLIDSLMTMNSCLKGGLSLIQSLEVLMEEMPSPSCEEFGLVIREVKVGIPIEEALVKLTNRMESEEIELVVSSILIARETGGNLPKIFSRLITTMRDRVQVREMADTLTLQGRIQGIVMSFIPLVFGVVVYKLNPHHFDIMFQTEIGRILLLAVVILQIFAIILIRKFSIVKI